MLVRWTIPRFRFDQKLISLAWKVMMPLALVNLIRAVLVVHQYGWSRWWLLPVSLVILFCATYFTMRLPRSPGKTKLTVREKATTSGRPPAAGPARQRTELIS